MVNFTIEARIFNEATQSLGPAVTLDLIKDGQFNPDLPDSLLVYQNAQWVYYQKRQADAEKKDPAAWLRARKYENSEDLSWDQVIINPKAHNKYLYYFRGLVSDQLKAMSLQTPNILRQMNERKIACQGQLNREKEDIERKEKERLRALPVFPKKPDFPVKETAIPTDKIYLIKAYVEDAFDDIPDMPEAFTDAEWWESTWALEQQELMAQILSPTKGQISLVNTNMPHGASELLAIKQARYGEMLAKMTPEQIDAYFGVVFQNEGDNKPTIGDVYYQIQKILHDKVYELRKQTGIDYTQRIDLANLSPLMPSASGAVKVGEYVQKRKELINTELNDQAVVVLSNAFVEYTQNRTGDSIPIDDTLTMGQAIYISHLLSTTDWKTENDDMVIRTVERVAWATQSISIEEFMDQLVGERNEHARWSDPEFNDMFNSTIDQRLRQFSTDISDFEKKFYSRLKVNELLTWYDKWVSFMGVENAPSIENVTFHSMHRAFLLESWEKVFFEKTKEEYFTDLEFSKMDVLGMLIPASERYHCLSIGKLPDAQVHDYDRVYIPWLRNHLTEEECARFIEEKNLLDMSAVLDSSRYLLVVARVYPGKTLEKALMLEGAFEKFKMLFMELLDLKVTTDNFIPLFKVLVESKTYLDYIIDVVVNRAKEAYNNNDVFHKLENDSSTFIRVFTKLPEDKKIDFLTNAKIDALINQHQTFGVISWIHGGMTDVEFNRYISLQGFKMSNFIKSVDGILSMFIMYADENRLAFLEREDVKAILIPFMTQKWIEGKLFKTELALKLIDCSMDSPIYFSHYLSLIAKSEGRTFYERFVKDWPLSKAHMLKLMTSDTVLTRFREVFTKGDVDALAAYQSVLTEQAYDQFCQTESVYTIINSAPVESAKTLLMNTSYLPKNLRYQYINQESKINALSTRFKPKYIINLRDLLNEESFAKLMKEQWMVNLVLHHDFNESFDSLFKFFVRMISKPPFIIDPDKDTVLYQQSVKAFYDMCIGFFCKLQESYLLQLLNMRDDQDHPDFYRNFLSYDRVKMRIQSMSNTVAELAAKLTLLEGDLYQTTLLCDHSITLIAKSLISGVYAKDKAVYFLCDKVQNDSDLLSLLIALSLVKEIPSSNYFTFLRSLNDILRGRLQKLAIYDKLDEAYIKSAFEQTDYSIISGMIFLIPRDRWKGYIDFMFTLDVHKRVLANVDAVVNFIDKMAASTRLDFQYLVIMKCTEMLTLDQCIPFFSNCMSRHRLSADRCVLIAENKGLSASMKIDNLENMLALEQLSDAQRWHILATSQAFKHELKQDLAKIDLLRFAAKESGSPEDRLAVLMVIKDALTPAEPKETNYSWKFNYSWKYSSDRNNELKLTDTELYNMLSIHFTDDELGKIGVGSSNTPSNGVL